MDDCAVCGMKDGESMVLSPFAPSMCWLEVTKSGEHIQMKFGYGDDDRDRIFYFPRYCPECGRKVKRDE